MNLYLIQYDRGSYYVEAESIANAVRVWQAAMLKDGLFETEADEPETISIVSDCAVIRGGDGEERS